MSKIVEAKLLKFETYGIKNLIDKVSLDFSNKTIEKNPCKSAKIKAIYGGNGSGKSALMNSIALYKNIAYQDNFLVQDRTQKYLKAIYNENCDGIFFKSYFYIKSSSGNITYFSHLLKLSYYKESFVITHENISTITGRSLSEDCETTLYEVKNGLITSLFMKEHFDLIDEYTRNLLLNKSLITSFFLNFINNNSAKDVNASVKNFLSPLVSLFYFLSIINVKLEDVDGNIPNSILIKQLIEENLVDKEFEKVDVILKSSKEDIVPIKKYDEYLKGIDSLSEFIKVFKSTLKNISIDKKIDGENYHCKKIFNYEFSSVDIEYESTGIKKLVELFPYIERSIKGDIIFIDEMDANISGVFLNKLIEFIDKEGKGQLCFTSHNLDQLGFLKSKYHAIDFISEDTRVIPWKKNGNYSPARLYQEGMIDGCPFNFDYYSFYRVFDTED